MRPTVSYKIWYTQRSGSTYLSEGLIQTGLAGKPGEYFEIDEKGIKGKYGRLTSFEEFQNKVWDLGTSPNGIFGMKSSLHKAWGERFMDEMKKLEGFPQDELEGQQKMDSFFPNCKHIFLTRRNKVRQAVSWWKAIKDNVWHLREGESQKLDQAFFEENYNFDALKHLLTEIQLKECALEDFFTKAQINPLSIVYEDYIRDYEGSIKKILQFMEVDFEDLKINSNSFQKTANAGSESWVQRFREDLQKGWEQIVW